MAASGATASLVGDAVSGITNDLARTGSTIFAGATMSAAFGGDPAAGAANAAVVHFLNHSMHDSQESFFADQESSSYVNWDLRKKSGMTMGTVAVTGVILLAAPTAAPYLLATSGSSIGQRLFGMNSPLFRRSGMLNTGFRGYIRIGWGFDTKTSQNIFRISGHLIPKRIKNGHIVLYRGGKFAN